MGRYLLFLILVCVKGDFVWGQTKDVILEREQQTEDSLILALGNIPAFTIYKDNYIITGTNFEGGKITKYNSDAKFQISLRHRLYRKLLPYRLYTFLTNTQKSFCDI